MGSSTIESRFIINNLTGSKLPSDFRPACQPQKSFVVAVCVAASCVVLLSWSFNQWQWHGGEQELQNSLGRHIRPRLDHTLIFGADLPGLWIFPFFSNSQCPQTNYRYYFFPHFAQGGRS